MKKLIFLILMLLFAAPAFGLTTSSITYTTAYGNIVFTFDGNYTYGQFASGDYWVVGPLTINSITPTHASGEHGCEVNPATNSYSQGFDNEIPNYVESLNLTFPYYVNTATGIKSIVKVISNTSGETRKIKAGRVLTVVASAPAGDGAGLFRPPYVGTTKTYYAVTDINSALIPSYGMVGPTRGTSGGAWQLATITTYFSPTNIEHVPKARYLKPIECNTANPDNYGPENVKSYGEGILSLMLNDLYADKLPAIKKVLQQGIDKIYWHLAGNWDPNTGHNPGETIVTSFTAALLNITAYKTLLGDSANQFDEEMIYTLRSSKYSNVVLWGLQTATETQYWNMIVTGDGNQSQADPYGYIDGGRSGTAGGYYTITGNGIKATVAVWSLMAGIRAFVNATIVDEFTTYVNRVFGPGMRNSPDPCAPYPYAELSGNTTGQGVTWGADPAHRSPPMCILDASVVGFNYSTPTTFTCAAGQVCGRMASRYAGAPYQYVSAFIDALWATHSTVPPAGDMQAPTFISSSPSGNVQCDASSPVDVTISVVTNEQADCTYSTTDVVFGNATAMSVTGGTTHTQLLPDLACNDALRTYFIKCRDKSQNLNTNTSDNDLVMTFTILAAAGDVTPPVLTNPGPNENYSCAAGGGPNTVTLRVTANDETTPITCKYSTTNQAYATMEGTFGTSGGTPAQDVDDHYPESNWVGPGTSTDSWVGGSWGTEDGQSFTSTGGVLDTVQFYLSKAGTGTLAGTMTVKIYDHSGVYGTSSLPNTGSLLATSGTVNASELTATRTLKTFTFSDAARITLVAGTKYFASLAYSGGDATTFVYSGGDTSAPSHGGNNAGNYGGWTAYPATDTIFYVNVMRGGSGDFSQDVSLACGNTYNYYFRCTDGTYPNLTSSTATFTIYPATPLNITEAESGTEVAPMMATADAAASGGYYISSTTLNEGTATISVTPAVAGTYRIRARIYHVDLDSMFLKIGTQDEILWDMNPSANAAYKSVWREDYVKSREAGTPEVPQYDPYYVTLTTDAVDFVFRGREQNARLDWFGLELQDTSPPPPYLFGLVIISTGNTYLLGTGGATMKLE